MWSFRVLQGRRDGMKVGSDFMSEMDDTDGLDG